jgi:hypothetical protein
MAVAGCLATGSYMRTRDIPRHSLGGINLRSMLISANGRSRPSAVGQVASGEGLICSAVIPGLGNSRARLPQIVGEVDWRSRPQSAGSWD